MSDPAKIEEHQAHRRTAVEQHDREHILWQALHALDPAIAYGAYTYPDVVRRLQVALQEELTKLAAKG